MRKKAQNFNPLEYSSGASLTCKNEKIGLCPICKNTLVFEKGTDEIFCHCCNQSIEKDDIESLASGDNGVEESKSSKIASLAMMIDSPESALVFLERFFEDYDWEYYQSISTIEIEEIDGMVEKNKIKHGASSASWILDFESKILPINKKIKGLKILERKIAELYNPIDNTEELKLFDDYVRIARALVENKNILLKQLSEDIEEAKKHGAGAATCDGMAEKLTNLKLDLVSVKVPLEITDLDEVTRVKEIANQEIAGKLKTEGIDAETEYRKAVEAFAIGKTDKSIALKLFEKIKGYKDSAKYVNAINAHFNYDYDLFYFFGKHFIFKVEEKVFNPKAKKKKKNYEDDIHSYALYEIDNGKVAEEPILTGLTNLLTCYGNKLFYVANNKDLCCYDVHTKVETLLDEGNVDCFVPTTLDNDTPVVYFTNNNTSFFLRKRLPVIGRRGCFSLIKKVFVTLFRWRKRKKVNRKDNYSIVQVDMINCKSTTLIDSLVDITKYRNNQIFYITADPNPKSTFVFFNVCNALTGEKKQILDDTCEINGVVGNKVIFSRWTPNFYNKDLYSYDLDSGEQAIIEQNVFYYLSSVKDRIFYTVGNEDFCPLYSNNTSGTDRREIMQNVVSVEGIIGDWMYIIRGDKKDRNRALIKVSADGKHAFVVCTQLLEIVKFNDSYIYYIDTNHVLHVVRNDGQNNVAIAGDIDPDKVFVGNKCIYYLRKELVGPKETAYSLYKMDPSGHNPKKLVFNVCSFKNCDESSLYIKKIEKIRFEITIPVKKDKNDVVYEQLEVTRYYKFDKESEKLTLILSQGLPEKGTYKYNPGCLRKNFYVESTYREANETEFKYENIAEPGEVYKKALEDKAAGRSLFGKKRKIKKVKKTKKTKKIKKPKEPKAPKEKAPKEKAPKEQTPKEQAPKEQAPQTENNSSQPIAPPSSFTPDKVSLSKENENQPLAPTVTSTPPAQPQPNENTSQNS